MKKIARKKRTSSKKKLSQKGIWYFLKYYFLSIISVFLITLAISLVNFTYSTKITYCANSISCVKNLTLNIENKSTGVFEGKKITPPKIVLNNLKSPSVLGISTSTQEKHIYVDLTHQTLSAYDGNKLFMKTLISSGKWHPTPDGNFKIWIKLRATRMTGGEGADFYDLPNVPFVMFFSNAEVPKSLGFSLHGAYWHNNFGHPMSHGCVNMRIVDAEKLYDWVTPISTSYTTLASTSNPGTEVTIFGTAPID